MSDLIITRLSQIETLVAECKVLLQRRGIRTGAGAVAPAPHEDALLHMNHIHMREEEGELTPPSPFSPPAEVSVPRTPLRATHAASSVSSTQRSPWDAERGRLRWTVGMTEEAERLLEEGLAPYEVATRMGIRVDQVLNKIHVERKRRRT